MNDGEFWNAHERGRICSNAIAAGYYVPLLHRKTALVLAGDTTASPRDLILNDPKQHTFSLKAVDGNFACGYAGFCTEHQRSLQQVERLKAVAANRVKVLIQLAGGEYRRRSER